MRVKAKAIKEKKRVKIKVMIWKKIENKVLKNIEISLQKKQTSKCKVILSIYFIAKKK